MWNYVGPADVVAVLSAWVPGNDETLAIMQATAWGVWRLTSRADVGAIQGQNPDGTEGTIETLHPAWVHWVHAGGAPALHDLTKHVELVAAFVAGGYERRPVLITSAPQRWSRRFLDGRHRLYAAYEMMHQRVDRSIEVFWNSREP